MAEQAAESRPRGLTPEELDAFARTPVVARLGMIDDDGYPYVIPVWFEYDGAAYWVVAREHVGYIRYVQREPRVALSLAEDVAPFRRALVRGRVEIVEGPASEGRWVETLTRIASRYRGEDAARDFLATSRHIRRYLLRITPESVVTFRGFR
jgi:nitroimidazol reductase NimA-like FMN-containing flavoprotein (pyridoxamine 5'-phosphate oxidase superfamily)